MLQEELKEIKVPGAVTTSQMRSRSVQRGTGGKSEESPEQSAPSASGLSCLTYRSYWQGPCEPSWRADDKLRRTEGHILLQNWKAIKPLCLAALVKLQVTFPQVRWGWRWLRQHLSGFAICLLYIDFTFKRSTLWDCFIFESDSKLVKHRLFWDGERPDPQSRSVPHLVRLRDSWVHQWWQ